MYISAAQISAQIREKRTRIVSILRNAPRQTERTKKMIMITNWQVIVVEKIDGSRMAKIVSQTTGFLNVAENTSKAKSSKSRKTQS